MAYTLLPPEEKAPETGLQKVGRGLARTAARAGETIADIPKNIFGLTDLALGALGTPKKALQTTSSESLPSAREAITKPLTGEYLEPQNETEKYGDQAIEDITGLLIGRTPVKFAVLGTLGANLAEFGAKEIGLPESVGKGIKAGALLATSLFGARNKINNTEIPKMYGEVETIGNSVGKPVPISRLRNKTAELSKKVNKRSFEGKEVVKNEIREMNKLLRNEEALPFNEVLQRKKDINQKISPKQDKTTRAFLSELSGDTKDTLLDFGKRNKLPELNRNLIEADELFAASRAVGPIENFVKKIPGIEKAITVPWLRHLILPSAGITAAKTLGPQGIAGVAATAYIGHEINRLFAFLANSPKAQKLYAEYAKNALIGNAGKVTRVAKELNKEAEKSEAKSGWTLIQ